MLRGSQFQSLARAERGQVVATQPGIGGHIQQPQFQKVPELGDAPQVIGIEVELQQRGHVRQGVDLLDGIVGKLQAGEPGKYLQSAEVSDAGMAANQGIQLFGSGDPGFLDMGLYTLPQGLVGYVEIRKQRCRRVDNPFVYRELVVRTAADYDA